jgi:hypothetical protein
VPDGLRRTIGGPLRPQLEPRPDLEQRLASSEADITHLPVGVAVRFDLDREAGQQPTPHLVHRRTVVLGTDAERRGHGSIVERPEALPVSRLLRAG